MEDTSSIKIGTPVRKSTLYPQGWQSVNEIPPDEVCCVIFGGIQTINDKAAHGYANIIKEFLPKKCAVYSATYDFAERSNRKDREAISRRYDQGDTYYFYTQTGTVTASDPNYTPQYFKDAYKKVIAPRLRNKDGNRISIEKLVTRLNKISLVAHCFGSTVNFEMEKLLTEDLKQMDYPPSLHDYILKQVHCSEIAPVTPYGVSKFTKYKFVSCSDKIAMSISHPKIKYVNERKKEQTDIPFTMNMSIMRPTANETVFAVNSLYAKEIYTDPDFADVEHTLSNYTDKDDYVIKGYDSYEREISGDFLSMVTRETINWIASNSIKNEKELHELPSIFTEQRFSRLIDMAQKNHYKMMKNEVTYLRHKKENSR